MLETWSSRRGSNFIPLIATPNRGDQIRAAFERAVDSNYGWMYEHQPAVRAVVDFMSRNVAQLALRCFERTSDIERHEASDHPGAEAMRNPNPHTPGQQFIFDLTRDYLVYGNAFALKFRVPLSPLMFAQLPPHRTSVLGPRFFTVDAYRIYLADGSFRDEPPENVFHWRGAADPNDPRLGLSPLETLRQLLAEDTASQAANVELLNSGLAKAGYLWRPPEAPEISNEAAQRLRESWANQQRDSARHTPLLEEGTEFRDFGVSPKDAEMLAGRRFTVEEVCRVYGLPKGLLGLAEGATLTEERNIFLSDVLAPLCEMFAAYLDLSILKGEFLETSFYFEFDLDEKLTGDERLKALTSATGAPVLTRNESRAMLNKPPKEGGDELITPMNVIVGGKPSPAVMPIQDPNGPLQDGSQRHSLNGHGKGMPFLPHQIGQHVRRDRYAKELTDALRKLFADQEKSMRSKGIDDFDLERWVKVLTAILRKLLRSAVEREGEVAATRYGLAGFAMSEVENYLQATAEGKSLEINLATRDALAKGNFTEVFQEAREVRAEGTGQTLATKMSNFAVTEAAKQSPDAEFRIKTWIVDDEDVSAHPEMNGERSPLTEPFSNGKQYPPYEHPGCRCMVSVT